MKEPSAKYLARPRYKQTELGAFPEEWTLANLEAFSAFITKGSTPTTYGFSWQQDGILFLRSECVSENGLDLSQSMFISEAAHASLRRSEIKDGDLLITITGNVGRVVVFKNSARANINQHIARVRIVAPEVDRDFVYHFLSLPQYRTRFTSITTGQAYPQISLKQVREAPVPLPPTKTEQEAIAKALSDADALIESLEQLLFKKRQIKQGAMQELLTGKKRLPGFSEEWEATQLGKIGSTFGGLTGKTKRDFGHGAARYITFMNIMTNIVIDCGTFEFVDVKPTELQNRVAKGDLFFNGSSETPEEVGMCAVLAQDVPGVFLNSFCFGFRFHDEVSADGLYLAYFFRSQEGRELMKSLAQGATRYNLSKAALQKVEFPLPRLPEQSAIAIFLANMDSEIAGLEAKLAKARRVKQGMMQELLTGRIRLIEPARVAGGVAC